MIVKKAIAVVIAGAVVLAALAGCGGPFAPRRASNSVMKKNKIVIIDRKARSYIRLVRELPPKQLDGGELEIGVVLYNKKSKDLHCDVKVQFVDEDGGETDETSWVPYIFSARTERTIRMNSMDPAAADYRLYIRLQR